MSDSAAAVPQAGDGGRPQAGTDAGSTAQTQDSARAAEAHDVRDLPSWAQKLVRDLRREAGDSRTRLQQIEDRDKTDLQKATERAAALEARANSAEGRARELAARTAVMDAAANAGLRPGVTPTVLYALVRDAIEFGDDGEPTRKGIDAAIAQVRRDQPGLFAAGNADAGAGANGVGPTTDMNALLRRAAGRAG